MQTVTAEISDDIGVHNLIDSNFTNDWERLIERTLIFINPFLLKRALENQSAKIEIAERAWYCHAMKDTRHALKDGKLRYLLCEEREVMIVVIGRAKHGLQEFFGKNYLPVIMSHSRVAFLIMLWAHKENHDVSDVTMSIACRKAWIVGAKKLVSSICNNCVRCRLLHRLKVMQQMTSLPSFFKLHVHLLTI